MQERKYNYGLSGFPGLECERASLLFNLANGFPTIPVTLRNTDAITSLFEEHRERKLIDREFTFTIDLVGVKKICNITKLVITNLQASETIEGYFCQADLMTRGAAFSTIFPATFISTNYKHTVRSIIQEIVDQCNTDYGNILGSVLYQPVVDPIYVHIPRFLNTPYFSMIKEIARNYGLSVFLDFNNNLRVFSLLSSGRGSTRIKLSKHMIDNSSLSMDILQNIVGELE